MDISKLNLSQQRPLKPIRQWMYIPGKYNPGPKNSITDVTDVTVGHCTVFQGDDVRTGVTIIKPHEKDPFVYRCPCAVDTGNGFGKMTGTQQIEELGELESLIGLTNTLAVAPVMQGILDYHIENTSPKELRSINIVVGETNDGHLNDIRKSSINPGHVREAIANLSAQVEEGAVGAGTGTVCFGFKGGIGTSSRIVPGESIKENRDFTVGVLVQSNYGGNLTIYGHSIEKNPVPKLNDKGSCMIIVATDAPVDTRQLRRFAKRGLLGLVNTGSYMSHGSGDFCLAFSNYQDNLRHFQNNNTRSIEVLSDAQLSPFFNAIVEAATEALYNSMTMARTTKGYDGNLCEGINLEDYEDILPLKQF